MRISRRVVDFLIGKKDRKVDPRSRSLRTDHSTDSTDLSRPSRVFVDSTQSSQEEALFDETSWKNSSVLSMTFPKVEGIHKKGLTLWTLPYECSQSRVGGRMMHSSACTLICVKLFEILAAEHQVRLPDLRGLDMKKFPCPAYPFAALINAIVEGNEWHALAMSKRKRLSTHTRFDTFTVPEAISACNNCIKELDFIAWNGITPESLIVTVHGAVRSQAVSECSRVYMLIIAFQRTTALVFDRKTDSFFFFDSHSHQKHGALICHGPWEAFFHMAYFICNQIYPESWNPLNKNDDKIELSVVHYEKCRDLGESWLKRHSTLVTSQKIFLKKGGSTREKKTQTSSALGSWVKFTSKK
ncbi:hypothetical protein L596_011579 [Steinernema carpocapsae]|uniref:Uncharacterized protein n=1 Tax=Steinernema carpocapsae TaxID=34508 RepID=A0A4U5NVA4_STECR|nr:hypothetical protein L596_011579 [Steinernema carpocapsae]